MFGRYQHDKILVVNRPCTQTVEIDRQRDADHVELVLTQLLQEARGEVLLDHQRHLRYGLAQYRHEARQQIGAHRVDRAEAQLAGEFVVYFASETLNATRLASQRLAGSMMRPPTGVG